MKNKGIDCAAQKRRRNTWQMGKVIVWMIEEGGLLFLKGNILYMSDAETLHTEEDAYLVIDGDKVAGVYSGDEFEKMGGIKPEDQLIDYKDKLIIPGMTDLHIHAPQYAFRGLGMDEELLAWLQDYAFLEEARYANLQYAKDAYRIFADDLLKSPTTRACVFATVHRESALLLAQLLDKTGLVSYVGKVNMDMETTGSLREDIPSSIEDTRWFISHVLADCLYTRPIITPRFAVSCSAELLEQLGDLRAEYHLGVQSHLSESLGEIELVKKLHPMADFYGDVYDRHHLFGGGYPVVMAHCVHSTEQEIELMKAHGVTVAHCPNSNFSLLSGIAPVRKYLDDGLCVGLGTDIAGGFSISMFRAIQDAVAVSKLYECMVDQRMKHLSVWEAFYLATLGGGSFFGKVGSFLTGYEADVLVLDDSKILHTSALSTQQRLERIFYLAEGDCVYAKYVQGRRVF